MAPGSFLLQLVNRETRIVLTVFPGHPLNLREVRDLGSSSLPARKKKKSFFDLKISSPGCDRLSVTTSKITLGHKLPRRLVWAWGARAGPRAFCLSP